MGELMPPMILMRQSATSTSRSKPEITTTRSCMLRTTATPSTLAPTIPPAILSLRQSDQVGTTPDSPSDVVPAPPILPTLNATSSPTVSSVTRSNSKLCTHSTALSRTSQAHTATFHPGSLESRSSKLTPQPRDTIIIVREGHVICNP